LNQQTQAAVIDGRLVAKKIRTEVKKRVRRLRDAGHQPGLAAVLVGDNPASQTYVASKVRTCERLGIYSEVIRQPSSIAQDDLVELVQQLNRNGKIHGILVQSPLPDHIDELAVTLAIDPAKDVDGFHPHNVGLLQIGRPHLVPCTPFGIIKLLEYYEVPTTGREVVVVGRSNIVGKPIASLLMQKGPLADATVTVAHSRTRDLAQVTRRADVLIAAIGRAGFITADMVSEETVVIDVGINRVEDPASERGYRLVGDVSYDEVAQKASMITPVPGGVGPMTIALLVSNTVKAAEAILASKE